MRVLITIVDVPASRRWMKAPLTLDSQFIRFLRAHGERILGVSLGVVCLWFGLLKLWGISPVEDLVAATVYRFNPD